MKGVAPSTARVRLVDRWPLAEQSKQLFYTVAESNSFGENIPMSGDSKLTFFGISRAIFHRLRRKASQRGIHVVTPTGQAVKNGVRIQWKYDPISEQLEVGCVQTPFWMDPARINSDLREEIEAALDDVRAA